MSHYLLVGSQDELLTLLNAIRDAGGWITKVQVNGYPPSFRGYCVDYNGADELRWPLKPDEVLK